MLILGTFRVSVRRLVENFGDTKEAIQDVALLGWVADCFFCSRWWDASGFIYGVIGVGVVIEHPSGRSNVDDSHDVETHC